MRPPLEEVSVSQLVDVNVPRFNQSVVAVLTAAAFVARLPWLVAAVAAVLALSVVGGPRRAPLTRLYVGVIRPRRSAAGAVELEPAAPPRFAQALGALVLAGAAAAFAAGAAILGWALTLLVTTLAALAATTRICVGCLLYHRVVGS
jgi:hypothetical protein